MLSVSFRALSDAPFRLIRDAAKEIAKEFASDGVREFVTRWGDNVMAAGAGLKDAAKADVLAATARADLDAFKRQAVIVRLYEGAEIPSPSE